MPNDLISSGQNLSTGERALSAAAGLFLAAVAVKPRPNHVLSLLVLAAGVGLALRAASGHCPLKASLEG